ncbi:hypothetical protein [Shimazuella alba]|uniref:Uncharacterized protein n=1 Tax=Shimazuella alba TaxID=2690964 RepID=A0A6I4VWK4_9BACL|nr:hypothetical protein [Shimazuella alba]MXQ55293.1 hypothetical protein [Shimazuella alba]
MRDKYELVKNRKIGDVFSLNEYNFLKKLVYSNAPDTKKLKDQYHRIKNDKIKDRYTMEQYLSLKRGITKSTPTNDYEEMKSKAVKHFMSFENYKAISHPWEIPKLGDYEEVKDTSFKNVFTYEGFLESRFIFGIEYVSKYIAVEMQEGDQEIAQQLDRIRDIVVRVFGKEETDLIHIGNKRVSEIRNGKITSKIKSIMKKLLNFSRKQ